MELQSLQDAIKKLIEVRKELATGSMAVWRKIDHAIKYLNEQVEAELADDGHTKDSDCYGHINPETGECLICHVFTGHPCPTCRGIRYHTSDCKEMENF